MITSGLKPERVFYYFEKLSSIPRGSGNEKAVSDYCKSVAEELNLFCEQDEANNILIRKPASEGCEGAEGIIIQGHLDMVAEKTSDSTHDFRTASGCIERLPRNDDGGDRPVPFLQPS